MGFNPYALSKTELRKRKEWKCQHYHTGISHPQCYDKSHGIEETIGFLDIETSNLVSNYGVVWSYCIKKANGKIISNGVTAEEIKTGVYDKRLLKDFCRDVRLFDRVITWYGKKFDIPFLRSRCLFWKLPFPIYKEIKHTDAYFIARYQLKLSSNKLGVVAGFFGIPAKHHPLTFAIWLRAFGGDQKALDYIITHNKEDVITTERVWERLCDAIKVTNTSI